MPRKIMEEEEKPVVKPKREITEAQRQHLNKIRELALQRKKEMKEVTLKAKLAKTVPKQELAKSYDEYVAKKVIEQQAPELKPQVPKQKPKPLPQPESESEESEVEEIVVKKKKPVKKIKKKIIYESESESEEEIVVKKKPVQKAPLEKLVYNNTKEQLYNRMIEERVRNSLMAYSNALGV